MNNQNHVVPSGQHYSGRNRVPNIQEFMAQLDREKQERDAEIDDRLNRNAQHGEVQEHQQRDEKAEKAERKDARWVRDPVTGKDVQIRDAKLDFEKAAEDPQMSVPNENLGKETTVPKPKDMSREEYQETMDISAPPDPVQEGATSDVPIRSEKTSVLFYNTPSVSYEPMFESLENRANGLCLGIFLAIVFIGKLFGGRLLGLIPLGFCIASGVFLWCKELIRQGRDVEWSSEQARGETATVNLIPESVEWMNTAIGIIWGLINPEVFAAVGDTLEDVMAASVPGIIENVRVADIHQGSNPIRILNMRALPDSHVQDIKEDTRKQNEKTMDPNERAAMEEAGEFYNMEVSVAYHAKPSGQDVASKARNMGMQLVFYLGIRGLFGVPLPVWVELQGLVATARLRLQLTPDPPFLKTMTVTLMGVPNVQAGCTPMIQRGVNVLNLPLISKFVNWAISAAASMYVAPKSLTLDVSSMLTGDDIKKDTIAMGVLYIRINKAVDLSKQDQRGSKGGGSDPYITICWSKFSKPQFCTRVIQDDLNPYFGESCGLLVTPDIIQADEQLSVELWDSDRSSADDVVGKVELSIQELINHPGKVFPQVSKLTGMSADSSMPGELHWEVGFFGKTLFRKALRTDEKNPNLPDEIKNKPEPAERQNAVPQNAEAEAALHTPPDPLWPSGILSVVVHQIVGLELANIRGSDGNRKGKEYEPARPEAGEVKEAEHKKLPSSYCTILINDDLAYKTRTKVVSSQPIFNAGTEKFVRDWRSSIVTVAVRDARHRQHDPLIGVIPLKISDILQTSSEVTRWYPLDGGIGFGRARISILFKSVELRLPPPEMGWEIGTFEFTSDKIETVGYAPAPKAKLRLRTGGSTASVRRSCSTKEGDNMIFDVSGNGHSQAIRLPVRHRYRSPVFFEFNPVGKRHSDAFAAVWLKDLADSDEQEFDVPLWKCNNSLRLSQNYITEENFKEVPDLDIEEIGRVKFRGRFSPGTDSDHIRFVSDNDSRETIETWEACYAEGVRETEVKSEVPPLTKELHENSLTQGRDVLAKASEEERKRWLAKDGTDWSQAFGEDPSQVMGGTKRSDGDGDDEEDNDSADSEDETTSGSSRPETGVSAADTSELQPALAVASSSVGGSGAAADDGARVSLETTTTAATVATGASDTSKKSHGPLSALKEYRENSRDLHRKQRGLMQWRPMRNVQFAKDEVKYLARKVRNITALDGRKPDVETEV